MVGVGDIGFATNNNVQQGRTAGGWVKAMVVVNTSITPFSIVRCFNSSLVGAAATTLPCGLNLQEIHTGSFTLGFNFDVADRFYLATLSSFQVNHIVIVPYSHDTLSVTTFDANDNYTAADYNLVVF